MNESPLGAAALAGTSFPIDRAMTAKDLGSDRPMRNSLDAVADRDFVLELLSSAAISAMHLSRLAEEIVIATRFQLSGLLLVPARILKHLKPRPLYLCRGASNAWHSRPRLLVLPVPGPSSLIAYASTRVLLALIHRAEPLGTALAIR